MKTYVIDIDGTICTKNCELQGSDYTNSKPIRRRIDKINDLYDKGNKIIYMTARGMGRHNNNPLAAIQDFYTFTAKQLKNWGCKYHHLFLGKPSADAYIDDKGISDEDFFAN
jgi:hypothetical protein|tara:strand:- start:1823 stop:2158 length:336 start_codon:yes stop_codon:yes gene_type:complete